MTTPLREAKNLLVRRWGEMGGYWGINRTMAEIHALLFVTRRPLCTDDLMDQLKISRGNASMNLRGLVDWGLIERVHKLGDRKEYFQADTDVWHMFETIMRERRRREVEPIIATIDRCCELVEKADRIFPDSRTADAKGVSRQAAATANDPSLLEDDPEDVREFHRRVNELKDFLAAMGSLFELILTVGGAGIHNLAKMIQPGIPVSPRPAMSPARKRR